MPEDIDASEIEAALAQSGVSNDHERWRVVDFLMSYRRVKVLPAEWKRVRRFVLLVVADSGPVSVEWAKPTVGYVAGFVLWATGERGAPLDRQDLFYPHLISQWTKEHYAGRGRAAPNAERRLTAVAAALRYPREHLQLPAPRLDPRPYTRQELISAFAWARTRSTGYGREQAALAVSSAAGAGVRGSELIDLERHHIRRVVEGYVIDIPGNHPRTVPVRTDWAPLLQFSLNTIDSKGYVYRRRTRSAQRPQSASWKTGGGTGPQLTRLRASWIVAACNRLSAADVTYYAGFTKLTSLAPYERYLPSARRLDEVSALLWATPNDGVL
ncbi:hypothetical protein [Curtobacterium flaccumfaciens]|uniref:hypothetical protein n=1 Tax=Curtobacterium flaccumfaciens TaxID=2035 RepID=UPI00342FA7F1